MKSKGLTLTLVFKASSANYGESNGNYKELKKYRDTDGKMHTYISRQALRYDLVNQLGEPVTPLTQDGTNDKAVLQFAPSATIDDYPEIDSFGYMKTSKGKSSTIRSAKVRLSAAKSQSAFTNDSDFLTNMALARRAFNQDPKGKNVKNSIMQSEIHESYYVYTATFDLDELGIDVNTDSKLAGEEIARRVNKLLNGIHYHYRDISGRRENLSPLFIIGGIYDRKNPFFLNAVKVKKDSLDVKRVLSPLKNPILKENTMCAIEDHIFDNEDEIKEALHPMDMNEFFEELKKKVSDYYESNQD